MSEANIAWRVCLAHVSVHFMGYRSPPPQKSEIGFGGRKRTIANHKWRAGRNSSPDPSFRPALILVGVFGDLRNQGKGRAGRKNEGAVADQRLLTGCYFLIANTNRNHRSCSKRPTSASLDVSGAPYAHTRMSPRISPVANRDRGALSTYRCVLGAKSG